MKCHDDQGDGQKNRNHSPIKHLLHMVLCCGLPFLIILLLPFIAGISPGAASVLGYIAPFLCPIMMLGMIPMMLKGRKSAGQDKSASEEKHQITDNQRKEK